MTLAGTDKRGSASSSKRTGRIPARDSHHRSGEDPSPELDPQPGERKKILCIDDSRDFATFLRVLFEDNGYQPITARDGREGLQKIEENDFDLIVLDLMMPRESGLAFLKEIRRREEYREIPVLMLTGFAASLTEPDAEERDGVEGPYDNLHASLRKTIGEMRECGDVGPEMLVDKPVDPDAFVERVRNLIGS